MPIAGNPMSGLDLLIPFIVALAKQTGLSKQVNLVITIVVYAIWTALSLYFGLRDMPHATTADIIASFPVAFAASLATGYAAYTTVWKGLFNEENLSHVTSIVKPPVTDDAVELTDDDLAAIDTASANTPPPPDAVG